VAIGRLRTLVEQKSALDLILPLLITWVCRLGRNIPAVVIDIASVSAAVCFLRLSESNLLVGKALPNEEPLMPLLKVLHLLTDGAIDFV